MILSFHRLYVHTFFSELFEMELETLFPVTPKYFSMSFKEQSLLNYCEMIKTTQFHVIQHYYLINMSSYSNFVN